VADKLPGEGGAFLVLALSPPAVYGYLGLGRELGVKTFFHPVALLLNPARAASSLIGIPHPPYFEKIAEASRMLGTPRVLVLRGLEGEPELSAILGTKAIVL